MRRQIFLTAILIAMVFKTGPGQASGSIHETEDYPFGFKIDTVTFDAARDTYNKWKERYLVKCNDDFRVICEGRDETRVEAIGFGLILTAYFADKDEFDGLYRFYQNKRKENANHMMAWNVSCDSINDPGSATDGDIDVAFALIVASGQWGGNYFEEAVNVIEVIKNSVVTTCDSLLALAPCYSVESDIGAMWGGCDLTDIQYYTPAFFRIFAEVSGDNDWSKLADDTYTILHAAAHPETGLVPDWQSVSGVPGGNSDRIAYYRYDACRVPWRMALDYLWNGNPYAREWCTKVSDYRFIYGTLLSGSFGKKKGSRL